MILIIILSILAGASTVIARNINSSLAEKIGLVQGTFYNYVTGLAGGILVFLISREFMNFSYDTVKSVPFWAYLGGLLGVMVVSSSNIVTPKVPAFYLTLLMFIGQLFSGIVVDYFNEGILSKGKLIGGILILAGLTYNLFVDKKNPTEIEKELV